MKAMDKMEAQQNEATRAEEVPPEQTVSREENGHGPGHYKSQRDLEEEIKNYQRQLFEKTVDNKRLEESFTEVQEALGQTRQELGQAQINLTDLAGRVRRAEAYELAYRRQVDELKLRLAQIQGQGEAGHGG